MKTITETNYVDIAEQHIKKLAGKVKNLKNGKQVPIPMVTTSKIRNLLAMISEIYNEIIYVQNDTLPIDYVNRISYLRVRFIYEAGREPDVRDLVKEANILEILEEIQGSKKNYVLFSRYMEALVAFHRYYGGKDI